MTHPIIKDVICCGCGLVCDDIEVVTNGVEILTSRNACIIGEHRFNISKSKSRYQSPLSRKENGELEKLPLSEALRKVANLLLEAENPLFYGWSSTTCEAQKMGISLARQVRGKIDGSSSILQGSNAITKYGISTCTLGQVKNRADLIIFWGCNPVQSHPRHLSRFAAFSGSFLSQGEINRRIIAIDVKETETSKLADKLIRISPSHDSEFISALCRVLQDKEIPNVVAGVNKDQIYALVEELKKARFGVIFYGAGLTGRNKSKDNVPKLFSLVRKLNEGTQFVTISMRKHFNEVGFTKTMLRETGFSFGVDFSDAVPRCVPGETSVVDILSKGLCDLALVVASDPVSNLPISAVQHLARIPLIVVDPHWSPTAALADLVIPSAISGIETGGVAYRLDDVPLQLRKLTSPPEKCLPDELLLQYILKEVRTVANR